MRRPTVKKYLPHAYAALALFFASFTAEAHVLPFMVVNTKIHADGRIILFETTFNAAADLQAAGGATREEKLLRVKSYYEEYFAILYGKTPQASTPCAIREITDYTLDKESPKTLIRGSYACGENVQNIDRVYVVTDAFSDAFVSYDHFVSLRVGNRTKNFVYDQNVLTNFPLDPKIAQAIFPENESGVVTLSDYRRLPATEPVSATLHVVKRFIRLGVEHILSGTDHILFLLSVIITVVSLREILLLVTSFTIAHSVTLILAGLGYITLTSRIVEPFIAASIVFVAVWNIVVLWHGAIPAKSKKRWLAAFGFGLVHGLGFAGSLRDVEIPSQFFISALLMFNVGVELGQLAILIVVVPLLVFLDRKYPEYRRKTLLFVSAFIAAAATYWFIERIGIF